MIQTATDGPVRTLTLDRPDKRNALSADLVTALKRGLDEAATDKGVRVVVLAGAGKVFSAGADLAALEAMQTASFSSNLADSRLLASLFDAIHRHPKPIIAKVHGHAIAGGCGLAAVCDFALVAEEAKLGFTEVRIGFVPAIVAVYVARKLGEADLRSLFLRGRLITAEVAARIGLVTRVVPAAELDAAVAELAAELVRETSGSAVALTKTLLTTLQGLSLEDALEAAAHANAEARATADCKAGVRAFLQREPPPWKQEAERREAGA